MFGGFCSPGGSGFTHGGCCNGFMNPFQHVVTDAKALREYVPLLLWDAW